MGHGVTMRVRRAFTLLLLAGTLLAGLAGGMPGAPAGAVGSARGEASLAARPADWLPTAREVRPLLPRPRYGDINPSTYREPLWRLKYSATSSDGRSCDLTDITSPPARTASRSYAVSASTATPLHLKVSRTRSAADAKSVMRKVRSGSSRCYGRIQIGEVPYRVDRVVLPRDLAEDRFGVRISGTSYVRTTYVYARRGATIYWVAYDGDTYNDQDVRQEIPWSTKRSRAIRGMRLLFRQ